MAKNYSNILKDIDTIIIAANTVGGAAGNVGATGPGVFPMKYFGFLEETKQMKITAALRAIREGGGGQIQKGYDLKCESSTFEMLKGEATLIEKYLNNNCDIYLFGRDQVHRIKSVSPEVQIVGDLGVKSKQTVGLICQGFPIRYADNLELNGVKTTYAGTLPQIYKTIMESISQNGISFAVYASLGAFNQPTKFFDASAQRVVGVCYNSPSFNSGVLSFNGANQYVDFGSLLNIDDYNDLMIEVWIWSRTGLAALDWMGKYTGPSNPGWRLGRLSDNTVRFTLTNGTNTANIISVATAPINVWTHVAITLSRSGDGQMYINGAASGSPVSIAAISGVPNATSFMIGQVNGAYGYFDLASVKVYNYGVGGMPSNIATIIANNFAAGAL